MNLRQIRRTIVILILMLLSGAGGFYLGKNQIRIEEVNQPPKIIIDRKLPPGKEEVNFSLFWDTWDRLESTYLDKSALDKSKMVYGAISGLVSSLGDPYTVFLPPSEQKQSKEDLSGAFEGVGIQLGYKNSHLAVISPLKETPAAKAGVKAGDFIIRIKDEKRGVNKDANDVTLPEAVSLIRGPKGTSVTLALLREGQTDPIEVKLVRDTILVNSVELDFKEDIAHLRLLKFGERTDDEWEEAVGKIEAKRKKGEVKGVVFDLRNNPGGFLQGAVFIASEFLDSGVIVKQESSREGKTDTYTVDRKGKLTNIPLIVLINEGAASASEIVAGALQERNRAKVVGEKSFGKGTVQEAQDLPRGAGLHVTVARWLLPSGKSIDKEGIKPDYEVKMDEKGSPRGEAGQTKDPQLEKAIDLLKTPNF